MMLFFRLFGWFILRHAAHHRWRVLIVIAGIALGAAVFMSVRLAIRASVQSFTSSMQQIAGTADAVLIRPGGLVPETCVAPMLRNPDVASVAPVSTAYVAAESRPDEPFLLIGVDPVLEPSFRSWGDTPRSRQSGAWLELVSEPGTLIVAGPLADLLGVDPGGTVELVHLKRRVAFRVIDRIDNDGVSLIDGGRVAITDISSFQEFTGRFGGVDRIDVRLRPESDPGRLARLLPPGILMEKPSASLDSGLQLLEAYRLNLSILSFVSLFVGMFLVYSLIALHGASRRREIAILRSMGGTRRLLFFLFLAEGAFFGLAGWLAAFPVGTALVRYLLEGINETISTLFVRVHVDRLVLDPWEIFLSFAVTMVVAVVGALLPARETMQVAPKEVLSAEVPPRPPKRATWMAVGGCSAAVLAMALARAPGPVPGYAATFLLFTGFALMAPWILEKMGSLLPGKLGRLAGEPARLAAGYLRDSGVRAAVSVAALTTAVALFCALGIMVHSFRHTVETWVNQSVSGDLFIRPKMAEFNRYRDPVPPELLTALENLDETVEFLPYHRIFLDYAGVPYQFETFDFAAFSRYGSFLWVSGDPERVIPALEQGKGVIVSEVFANRTGLGPGDRYRAYIRSQLFDLPVLGVVRDYRTRGGVVFYSIVQFNQRFNHPPVNGTRIFFRERKAGNDLAVERLRNRILKISHGALEVTAGRQLRWIILEIFDQTFAVTFVLLVISLVVAGMGIASTLAVLVLERRRQFNTLLAVGGSPGQVRTVIFWEALLMTLAGEAIGILCGFLLSYLLIFVINRQSFGWTFLYRIDWGLLAVSLPLILAAAVLTCLPAVRLVLAEPPAMLLREK
ncbi:MAG: FtsX-like permease family protein [Desulfobacterales bacterium]|jgi:putative ABC transport system permease protein